MRAVIRHLSSPDIDDPTSWSPEVSNWELQLRILAGPDDGQGEESLDMTVCSLGRITDRLRQDTIVDGRHLLVMERFDWPMLNSYIRRRVERCTGNSWAEVAEKLSRLGHWEFEDYRSDTQ